MVPKAPIDPLLLVYCDVPAELPERADGEEIPDYVRRMLRIDSRNAAVVSECYLMQRGLVDAVKRRE